MRLFLVPLLLTVPLISIPVLGRDQKPSGGDEFAVLLERLRKEDVGDYGKVVRLAETNRPAALQFLRKRFGKDSQKNGEDKTQVRKSTKGPAATVDRIATGPAPARIERFTRIETIVVGDFSIDLCRREDGAFGLGEIRKGSLPLRRADFLITWEVAGRHPILERRNGLTVELSEPPATLTFTPERRESAGTTLDGFRMHFTSGKGPIVETASWELGGTTRGLTYFDGYRGWHAPPAWLRADEVPETNPKLAPSLLHGTGFQFEHGPDGALVHFHTTPGDRLRNVSRGQALEFVTTFRSVGSVDRYIFVTSDDSKINLWTRGFEVAQEEVRRALDLPERRRELTLQWPSFGRTGFRQMAHQCAAATAREGFTAVSLYAIWDNADFHGGAKNMNVWDLSVCQQYGGEAGLKALVDECKRHNLRVIFWVPAGHLWDQTQLWNDHPDWLLRCEGGGVAKTPTGPVFGSLNSGFGDYFRDRIVGVIRDFGFDGVWMDTHLSFAQQTNPPNHATRLTAIYRDFIQAGAEHFLVEGDASAIGAYAVGINNEWPEQWGGMPEPDLYYGAEPVGGSTDAGFYRRYLRKWVAAGAPWTLEWHFFFSSKLSGAEWDAARREVREILRDYGRVKQRMVHRFVHEDGSGYTWTNDRDGAKVVWLLRDAVLPDGRTGEADKVYVIERSR